jgi:regulator of protease activity HflC (stomatin/prohibitin superfamily)
MTTRLAILATLAAFGLAIVPSSSRAIELQPGQWQETETGSENGKATPAETTTSCMTPAEAKDPLKGLALDKDMKGQCKTFDVKKSATGLSLRMQCGDAKQFAMDMTASFAFVSAKQYTGTIKSSVSMMGKTTTADKTIQARWIGAQCKK